MTLTAPGKLAALLAVIVGCFVYIIVTRVTHEGDVTPAWATITLVTGYLVGNGTGAVRGVPQAPVFAPKTDSTSDDAGGSVAPPR